MPAPILTLTTDFGLQDHYVATMKGVILSRCPEAQLIDLSHAIPKYSVLAAGYTVSQAAPYFPAVTVHLAVVDPGVGTARRPLLVEALGQFFVAPDNGLLSMILARAPHVRIREITNRSLWLPHPSSTFHGRDIFAPVAAVIAAGTARAEDVGPVIHDPLLLSDLTPCETAPNTWRGAVLSVDHFGNVITSFDSSEFAQRLAAGLTLSGGARQVTQLRYTFAGAPPDICFVYPGSSGYLEIAMNQGDAAHHLQLEPGSRLHLRAGA